MSGLKKFVMQGNLVELAVAFVMAAAFGLVVKAFVDMVMSLVGKIGGKPDFNSIQPGGVPLGAFITALVAFVILAAVVYFFVVKPYEAAKGRFSSPKEETAPADVVLLTEIRDLLAAAATWSDRLTPR
jgi:large conductance mechanosensitive channel